VPAAAQDRSRSAAARLDHVVAALVRYETTDSHSLKLMNEPPPTAQRPQPTARPTKVAHIAVGVSAYPEGHDAAALGAALARATGADLMLVGVLSDPLVMPPAMSWRSLRRQAEAGLAELRDEVMPDARVVVRTDVSVARALRSVVARQHRDLLVVGSSHKAAEGSVRIGKRARQLIGYAGCALAIAPRGMHNKTDIPLNRIGVGYEGGPESGAALSLAASIAGAAGAQLHVVGVVDDRAKAARWSPSGAQALAPELDARVRAELELLRDRAVTEAHSLDPTARVEVRRGRPADALLDLCADVDLLVIGSRRWGAVARLLLGSTGESLAYHATCPILIVPRAQGGS
jgi:nucleotide-binding universal stress UspA family protein